MKRTIISGLSLLALSAIAIETITTPIAVSRVAENIKRDAIATRHRDSDLPNPTSFEEALVSTRHRDSDLPNPTSFEEAVATRHRDSDLPNPTSFEEAVAANYGQESDRANPLLFPAA
jgi:hypothetical protein